MDLEPTFIQMVINMKVTGIMIFSKVWELTIIRMVTFIKDNGWKENQMVKEIIFIKVVRQFIRETGHKEKSKDLVS